ncbi:MAG: transglycosylase SLT domain-containing protein [Nitrospirales bacterium]
MESFASPASPLDRTRLLESVQWNDPDSLWAKRAGLRYGYWLKDSFPAEALIYLQRAVHEFPDLADYLHLWLGESYEQIANWQEAAQAFLKVGRLASNSLLASEGLYRAGFMFVKLNDCKQTVSTLTSAVAAFPDAKQAPRALWAMGQCAMGQGQLNEGKNVLRELWWHYPKSPESREAEQWLTRALGGQGFSPLPVERYQRAMALYREGFLIDAVGEFGRYLSEESPNPQFYHAQYQLAVALARLKRYSEAESILESLTRSDSSRTDEAWVWLGRAYLRQGKGDQLDRLTRELPPDVLAGDQQALIMIFWGIWLEDHDRWEEAIKVYEGATRVAHTLSQRLDALWRVGWLHYQREQFPEAARVFENIVTAAHKPRSESLLHAFSQGMYWWARSEQFLNDEERANQHFQALAQDFPYTYYGQLAKYRLSGFPLTPQITETQGMDNKKSEEFPGLLLQDLHYRKVRELLKLGLSKEAVLELQEVFRRFASDPQAFQELVRLSVQVKAYDLGIRVAIRHFGERLRKGELSKTSEVWTGAFPIGYQSMIQGMAPQHVDPYLVAGLIREESLYNPRALSAVGAKGLMQLMPDTAKRVARKVGMPLWQSDPEGLFDPERNIRLGSWYLGELINDFHGNLVYAVASYNAGPSAVKRWIEKYGHRPLDEFIEQIGYRETRGYVKRVLGSYWIYRTIFAEGCSPVSLDTFC